jgi:hypothetical protein
MREEWRARVADWIKTNSFDAELVVIGKHLMFWEHPQQFNSALAHFVDSLK